MPYGAEVGADGGVRFRLWAPSVRQVELLLGPDPHGNQRAVAMQRDEDGWFMAQQEVAADTPYRYRIDGRIEVPDPAARANDDVHGPSRVVDPHRYIWHDGHWRGRPWHEAVICELHVGAFTAEGTYRAAIDKLDHLVEAGITFIELMPLAEFAGRRGWGYDGVLWFAPESAYGSPEDLKSLVDAAHARGLGVLLDVVYNHFGPEGNWLHAYVPEFFNARHHTPWGAAINYDGPASRAVREFVIHNALYWIEEFHFDGLRLDAVHTICDDSSPHILTELADRVRSGPGRERHVHLVLENVWNNARLLGPPADPDRYDAQWNDDIHHCMHCVLTGEDDGYYVDFAERPHELLRRCLAEGFAYQGEPSRYRAGRPRGEPSAQLPPTAFVAFLQNHDQIGNRAIGDRLSTLARDRQALRALTAVLLLAPAPPMLFMGDEWAAPEPFPFFCDFGPGLAAAVREGRLREFARFTRFRGAAALPDANDPATFASAVLDWSRRTQPPHAQWLAFTRELLAIRAREVMPLIPRIIDARAGGSGARLHVRWRTTDGTALVLEANLSPEPVEAATTGGRAIFSTGSGGPAARLAPWEVTWRVETADGASRRD